MHRFFPLRTISPPVLAAAALALCLTGVLAGTPQARAMRELQGLIGDAACSTDTQCGTVAIGQRACGGPDAYLAWSTLKTDATALQVAADRYNRTQAAVQPPGSRPSICTVLDDPGAVCREERDPALQGVRHRSCKLRPPSPAPTHPSR